MVLLARYDLDDSKFGHFDPHNTYPELISFGHQLSELLSRLTSPHKTALDDPIPKKSFPNGNLLNYDRKDKK
ncbi:hypothetical protein N7517_003267 [Penicillium concentricum]|uniref:Uncharacterized protein n=1 Tax=Penicillium concentricum TaxID=293559 RepID=A0A9W9SVN1_9EURO|nr:uncharacterized protein N7517_003267 [Penicillium concentricum]KAJ5385356.1 hypothetical protein N7517_003267 [Penicillium concentricum]